MGLQFTELLPHIPKGGLFYGTNAVNADDMNSHSKDMQSPSNDAADKLRPAKDGSRDLALEGMVGKGAVDTPTINRLAEDLMTEMALCCHEGSRRALAISEPFWGVTFEDPSRSQ